MGLGEDALAWVGRRFTVQDHLTPRLASEFAATLGLDPVTDPGAPLPQGIHWTLAPDVVAADRLGPDGHPALGEVLPPITGADGSVPRRMWAASDVMFHDPLHLGEPVRRETEITAITEKHGRSGRLVFVTVHHVWQGAAGPAVTEDQTLVYRDPTPPAPAPAPPSAPVSPDWEVTRDFTPDPVMMARYSALTFNGHRIHYDADYARGTEGYAGLVIHGPLMAQALLLLAEAQVGTNRLSRFRFRGQAPAIQGQTLTLALRTQAAGLSLAVLRHDGVVAQTAEASL